MPRNDIQQSNGNRARFGKIDTISSNIKYHNKHRRLIHSMNTSNYFMGRKLICLPIDAASCEE